MQFAPKFPILHTKFPNFPRVGPVVFGSDPIVYLHPSTAFISPQFWPPVSDTFRSLCWWPKSELQHTGLRTVCDMIVWTSAYYTVMSLHCLAYVQYTMHVVIYEWLRSPISHQVPSKLARIAKFDVTIILLTFFRLTSIFSTFFGDCCYLVSNATCIWKLR